MGHIVNPLGKRLGFVRFWNSNFTSQTNKVEENKIYPYYTSIVKINNSFFKKKYLKKTGLLKFGEKILFEKNKIKNIIYLQDFKLEQTEWDFCQELQNASKVEGKVSGEVRRLSKLGENVKHLIYVSVREQNRRNRLKNLKKEKQSAQKFVNILNVGIVMLCCYWLVLKALLAKGFEVKGFNNMEINFLIWQEPEKMEFIDREAAYQEYIKAGGKRIGPFQYTKPPREEIFLTPKFIGEYITNKLKQKHLLKDVLKPLIKKLGRHKGIKGFKITCSGRFSRAERATYKWQKRGKLPLNNLKEFIEYDYSEATLRFGQVGIKVWLCYNKKNLKDLWERSNKII